MSTRVEGDQLLEHEALLFEGDRLYGSRAYVVTYDKPESGTSRSEIARRTLMPGARVYVDGKLLYEEAGTFPTIGST